MSICKLTHKCSSVWSLAIFLTNLWRAHLNLFSFCTRHVEYPRTKAEIKAQHGLHLYLPAENSTQPCIAWRLMCWQETSLLTSVLSAQSWLQISHRVAISQISTKLVTQSGFQQNTWLEWSGENSRFVLRSTCARTMEFVAPPGPIIILDTHLWAEFWLLCNLAVCSNHETKTQRIFLFFRFLFSGEPNARLSCGKTYLSSKITKVSLQGKLWYKWLGNRRYEPVLIARGARSSSKVFGTQLF